MLFKIPKKRRKIDDDNKTETVFSLLSNCNCYTHTCPTTLFANKCRDNKTRLCIIIVNDSYDFLIRCGNQKRKLPSISGEMHQISTTVQLTYLFDIFSLFMTLTFTIFSLVHFDNLFNVKIERLNSCISVQRINSNNSKPFVQLPVPLWVSHCAQQNETISMLQPLEFLIITTNNGQ